MISLSHLNKLFFFLVFVFCSSSFSEEEPVDIWKSNENQNEQNNKISSKKNKTLESPILSDDISKIKIKISEDEIVTAEKTVIGIFDPEENNFNY